MPSGSPPGPARALVSVNPGCDAWADLYGHPPSGQRYRDIRQGSGEHRTVGEPPTTGPAGGRSANKLGYAASVDE